MTQGNHPSKTQATVTTTVLNAPKKVDKMRGSNTVAPAKIQIPGSNVVSDPVSDFLKFVLSFTSDQLKDPTPAKLLKVPNHSIESFKKYHAIFKPLLQEEVRASLKAGYDTSDSRVPVSVISVAADKSDPAFGLICFDSRSSHNMIQNDVLLLSVADSERRVELISIVCGGGGGGGSRSEDKYVWVKVLEPFVTTKKPHSDYMKRSIKFNAVKLENMTTFMREYESLQALEASDWGKIVISPMEHLPPRKGQKVAPSSFPVEDLSRLFNASQIAAIQSCSANVSKSAVLIQGPPGTGKTHTVIGLLSAILHEGNGSGKKRILVCAPSNTAIDEIISRIVNRGLYTSAEKRRKPSVVRIGSSDSLDPAIQECCLSNILDKYSQKLDGDLQSLDCKVKELVAYRSKCQSDLSDLEAQEAVIKSKPALFDINRSKLKIHQKITIAESETSALSMLLSVYTSCPPGPSWCR
jgi:hypothetical protein